MAAVRIPHPFSVYVPQLGKIIFEAAQLFLRMATAASLLLFIFLEICLTKQLTHHKQQVEL
jgi:hypothetical protein